MRLFLVRHGESVDNAAGLYGGSRDSPLTSHGVLQARRLGTHLAALSPRIGPVHYIFSSNLQRAVKTAEAVAEAQPGIAEVDDVPVVMQLAELREKDFGSEEGKRFGTRLQSAEAVRPAAWVEPESRDAMEIRVHRFIDEHLLPTVHRGFDSDIDHSVVVVAHGIILNILLRCLLYRFGPEELNRLSRPDGVSGRTESLASWSNTGYLEATLNLVKLDAADGSAAIRMIVQAVNSNQHLSGLKKTRGGIGSAAFDPKQRTVDSLFSRAAKKPEPYNGSQ